MGFAVTRELAIEMARELIKLCGHALEPAPDDMQSWPNLVVTGQDVLDLRDMLTVLIEEKS